MRNGGAKSRVFGGEFGPWHCAAERVDMNRYGKDAAVIRVRRGESFVLALESTGGGYAWSVEQGQDRLRLVSRTVHPNSGNIGAATGTEFTFEALSPGPTALVLNYGRSWENAPLETSRIQVNIEP